MPKEGPKILEYAEGIAKSIIELINADKQKIDKVTPFHLEAIWDPISNLVQLFTSAFEKLIYRAIK